MDARNLELQRLKRRSDRIKRKYVTPWMVTTIVLLVIAVLLTPLCVGTVLHEKDLALKYGSSFWKLKNPTAPVYTVANLSDEALLKVQTEGMVLLKNENNALPLVAGSAAIVYGNDTLAQSLMQQGIACGTTGNAAILSMTFTQENQQNENIVLQNLMNQKMNGQIQFLVVLVESQTSVQPEILNNPVIDALLWTGGSGADAVAKILTGLSPAGSLAETWNYGSFPTGAVGIYTGYKYYETRYEDYVLGTGNAGNFPYSERVAYPFGFGLGYAEFTYSDFAVEYDGSAQRYQVSVTVTNGGTVPGKDIVQVYAQSPYTAYDQEKGIEKPAVVLVGFAKTGEVAPGGSETLTISVDKGDLASYDAAGAGTYILDAGDYYLTAASDAHSAVNNILAAKGYTPENTENRMDAAGNSEMTYKWTQPVLDDTAFSVSENGTAITNGYPVTQDSCVSRKDWQGTLSRTGSGITPEQTPYRPGNYGIVPMPTMGAQNGLKLYDVAGLPYDDPKWQTLLDQLTFADMVRFVTDGYGFMMPLESVQAPGAMYGEMLLPVNEKLLAAAFDPALAGSVGKYAGNTALVDGKPVKYLTFGGYEDSLLTGEIRAAQLQGIQKMGICPVLKIDGFAPCNEQTAREGALRMLRHVLQGNPAAGVTAGTLPVSIVRQEWDNHGMWISAETATVDGVLSGATLFTSAVAGELSQYENDPVIVSALRTACHNNLYALVNSAAMNGIGTDTQVQVRRLPLVTGLWIALASVVVAMIPFEVLWLRGRKKWQKTAGYLNYRTLQSRLKAEKEQ